MVWASLKREEKGLPIVLPSGWAVIKTKKNPFKSRFLNGFYERKNILSTSDPTPSSIRFRAWGQKWRG